MPTASRATCGDLPAIEPVLARLDPCCARRAYWIEERWRATSESAAERFLDG
jgi:hypothetical protein